MAVTTKGLCATIALICVIMPMIIGHCMPTGTEEKTVYETENYVNVTSDLVNASETQYSESISDFNNMPFLSATPVSITENSTSIRAFNSQFFQVYSLSPFYANNDSFTMCYFYFSVDPENQSFSFTHDNTSYAAKEILFVRDRSLFVAWGDFGVLTLHDNFPEITPSARYAGFDSNLLISPVEYVQISEGAYTGVWSGDQMRTPKFTNGYINSRVGFNIEKLLNNTHSQIYSVFDEDSKADITLAYNGGWVLSNGTDSVSIGDFKQIHLEFDAANHEVRLSTLTRSSLDADPEPRIIKTYSVPLPEEITGIETISLNQTTVAKAARIYCYSADIPDGTQPFIVDRSVNIAEYYPEQSVLTSLGGFAFYGDSVTIPGIGAQEVTDGTITFEDLTGTERTVYLRDSTIGAIIDEESGTYTVNVNGYVVAEDVAAADLELDFGGRWLFSMLLSPVTQRTVEQYVFDFTTLNITMTEYAFIGVVTALFAFVACALVGKRSGQKVIALLLTSGLAALIYMGMLL